MKQETKYYKSEIYRLKDIALFIDSEDDLVIETIASKDSSYVVKPILKTSIRNWKMVCEKYTEVCQANGSQETETEGFWGDVTLGGLFGFYTYEDGAIDEWLKEKEYRRKYGWKK